MSVRVCWWSRAAASPGSRASHAVVLGRLITLSSQWKSVRTLDGNCFPQESSVMETKCPFNKQAHPSEKSEPSFFSSSSSSYCCFLIILFAQGFLVNSVFYQSYSEVDEDLLWWLFLKRNHYQINFETSKLHSPKVSSVKYTDEFTKFSGELVESLGISGRSRHYCDCTFYIIVFLFLRHD